MLNNFQEITFLSIPRIFLYIILLERMGASISLQNKIWGIVRIHFSLCLQTFGCSIALRISSYEMFYSTNCDV